jgi:hypothetical protein
MLSLAPALQHTALILIVGFSTVSYDTALPSVTIIIIPELPVVISKALGDFLGFWFPHPGAGPPSLGHHHHLPTSVVSNNYIMMSRGIIELGNRNFRHSIMGAIVLLPWPTRSSEQSLVPSYPSTSVLCATPSGCLVFWTTWARSYFCLEFHVFSLLLLPNSVGTRQAIFPLL